jgi:hypothetical protein
MVYLETGVGMVGRIVFEVSSGMGVGDLYVGDVSVICQRGCSKIHLRHPLYARLNENVQK